MQGFCALYIIAALWFEISSAQTRVGLNFTEINTAGSNLSMYKENRWSTKVSQSIFIDGRWNPEINVCTCIGSNWMCGWNMHGNRNNFFPSNTTHRLRERSLSRRKSRRVLQSNARNGGWRVRFTQRCCWKQASICMYDIWCIRSPIYLCLCNKHHKRSGAECWG